MEQTHTVNTNPSVEVMMGPVITTIKCKIKSNHGRLIDDKVKIFVKGEVESVPDNEETQDYVKRGYLREISDEV